MVVVQSGAGCSVRMAMMVVVVRVVVVTVGTAVTGRTVCTAVVRMDSQCRIEIAQTVPRSTAGSRTGRTKADRIQRSAILPLLFFLFFFFSFFVILLFFFF